VAIHRAEAHHRLDQSGKAADLLRDAINYCRDTFGHYSYPTFGAVTALLDVYEDIGDPRLSDLLTEAHDIAGWAAEEVLEDLRAECDRRAVGVEL
jgi:hypothetical protein